MLPGAQGANGKWRMGVALGKDGDRVTVARQEFVKRSINLCDTCKRGLGCQTLRQTLTSG
jgi:hypothetical protein